MKSFRQGSQRPLNRGSRFEVRGSIKEPRKRELRTSNRGSIRHSRIEDRGSIFRITTTIAYTTNFRVFYQDIRCSKAKFSSSMF